MSEKQSLKLNRKQLYDEIWEETASGVAKKYNVPYPDLLKHCKEAYIPIPSSGYWTKLRFGKPVSQTELPDSELDEVELPVKTEHVYKIKQEVPSMSDKTDPDTQEELTDDNASDIDQAEHQTIDGKNVYDRDQLYREVWEQPVVKVAEKYSVSDVAIHKVCKSLDIPVPPRGYWAKLRAGQKVKKTPLPPSDGRRGKIGARPKKEAENTIIVKGSLDFLSESERQALLQAAQQIQVPDENGTLHKKIRAYKSVVREWNKNDTKHPDAQRDFNSYSYKNQPPFLAGIISTESLERVYRFLDTLYRQIEKLGGSVNDDLSLQIRNERVDFKMIESQNRVKHVITRQEAKEMMLYEDAKRHHRYASEPKIGKFDFVFNGKIRVVSQQHRIFRDTSNAKIETKLGDILIALFEKSEVVRIDREAREEAARKRAEEERRREERRERRNNEIERTMALTNEAKDYAVACQIRNYVSAVEAGTQELDEKTQEWVDWARGKADWYDPTIARDDELLGQREHGKNDEQKSLEDAKRYWWFR